MIKCDKIKIIFGLMSCFLLSVCSSNTEIGKTELDYSLVEVAVKYFDDFSSKEEDLKSYLGYYLIPEERVVQLINKPNELVELTFYFSFMNKSKYIPGREFISYTINEIELILSKGTECYVEKDKTVAFNPPLYPGEKTKYIPRARVIVIMPQDDIVRIPVLKEIIASTKYSFTCLYEKIQNRKLGYPDKTSILVSDAIENRIFKIEGNVSDLERISKYTLSF